MHDTVLEIKNAKYAGSRIRKLAALITGDKISPSSRHKLTNVQPDTTTTDDLICPKSRLRPKRLRTISTVQDLKT
jgi:hypothetical protein